MPSLVKLLTCVWVRTSLVESVLMHKHVLEPNGQPLFLFPLACMSTERNGHGLWRFSVVQVMVICVENPRSPPWWEAKCLQVPTTTSSCPRLNLFGNIHVWNLDERRCRSTQTVSANNSSVLIIILWPRHQQGGVRRVWCLVHVTWFYGFRKLANKPRIRGKSSRGDARRCITNTSRYALNIVTSCNQESQWDCSTQRDESSVVLGTVVVACFSGTSILGTKDPFLHLVTRHLQCFHRLFKEWKLLHPDPPQAIDGDQNQTSGSRI